MFLFVVDDAGGLDVKAVRVGLRRYGPPRELRRGGARLIWVEDKFITTYEDANRIRIECRRPQVDVDAICSLEWTFDSNRILVRRLWSGEFGAYYWRDPLIIASHLRLAALALGRDRVPGAKHLRAGYRLCTRARRGGPCSVSLVRETQLRAPFTLSRARTVQAVRRLVHHSVEWCPEPMALLLSGGIDSSALAAAAVAAGRRVHAFVFSVRRLVRPQTLVESDLRNARLVATHLGVPLTEVLLEPRRLVSRVPPAVRLAETARGTIIDECAALPAVACAVRRAGFDAVCIGEAADDLFGGFKFALRLYRGAALKRYYRRQLEVDLPDELAILQNVFRPWGISVIDPFWTRALVEIGYNLPLRDRVDPGRLMKTVLRDAFADRLPAEIVQRPKSVTRDATQIRDVLEQAYGRSRERYRPFFRFD